MDWEVTVQINTLIQAVYWPLSLCAKGDEVGRTRKLQTKSLLSLCFFELTSLQ